MYLKFEALTFMFLSLFMRIVIMVNCDHAELLLVSTSMLSTLLWPMMNKNIVIIIKARKTGIRNQKRENEKPQIMNVAMSLKLKLQWSLIPQTLNWSFKWSSIVLPSVILSIQMFISWTFFSSLFENVRPFSFALPSHTHTHSAKLQATWIHNISWLRQ